jgi:hypothetical protein
MLMKYGINEALIRDIIRVLTIMLVRQNLYLQNAQRKSSIDRMIDAVPAIGGLRGSCAGGKLG